MNKLKLKISIGKVARNLISDKDFAYVDVKGIYIPHGHNSTGLNAQISTLPKLKTYILDWYSLFKDLKVPIENITATIILNIKTNHKSFKGYEIINFLDKIDKYNKEDIYKLRNFDI